jgi:hypothetical protein
MQTWIILLALVALLQPPPATILPESRARLRQLLPFTETTKDCPQFYAGDLYRYIDGGAEAFEAYDMLAMVHCRRPAGDVQVVADIYDMGSALNAFGVYSSERSPDQRFVNIGAEGNATDYTLNFLAGRYYVKLSAFGATGGAALMERLARTIEQRIGNGKTMPAGLSLFPPEGLAAHSEKYVKRSPLGHDFLGPAFMASYGTSLLVLSEAGSATQGQERVGLLGAHFRETGKVAPWPAVPGAWHGSNGFEGEWVFLSRGRYVVILTNPSPQTDTLLKALFRKLPD